MLSDLPSQRWNRINFLRIFIYFALLSLIYLILFTLRWSCRKINWVKKWSKLFRVCFTEDPSFQHRLNSYNFFEGFDFLLENFSSLFCCFSSFLWSLVNNEIFNELAQIITVLPINFNLISFAWRHIISIGKAWTTWTFVPNSVINF